MRWCILVSVAFAMSIGSSPARAGKLSLRTSWDTPDGSWITDFYYTVTPGFEFTNWDLRITPTGYPQTPKTTILDPIPGQRTYNSSGGGPIPLDTFANTVFSAVGAGGASYIFTEYNPGQPFPPVPRDPLPVNGAVAPDPDELNWSIFDTATGDGNIAGFTPYHMARIVYTAYGFCNYTIKFFDTGNAGVGEVFSGSFGWVPEPTAAAQAWLAILGCVAVAGRQFRRLT